jgi:hypothetical protein
MAISECRAGGIARPDDVRPKIEVTLIQEKAMSLIHLLKLVCHCISAAFSSLLVPADAAEYFTSVR